MKSNRSDLYTLLTPDEKSFEDFFKNFSEYYQQHPEEHLILQLSENLNIEEENILLFLPYVNKSSQNGTTFVVICTNIEVDNFPESFNIVPTLQEAEDVLEMENIQRDLGF